MRGSLETSPNPKIFLKGIPALCAATFLQVCPTQAQVEIFAEINPTHIPAINNESKKRQSNEHLLNLAIQSKSENVQERIDAFIEAGHIHYIGFHERVDRETAMRYFVEAERIRVEEGGGRKGWNVWDSNILIAHAYDTGDGIEQDKDLSLKHIRMHTYPKHQDKSYEEILKILADKRFNTAAQMILADRIRGKGETEEEIAENNRIAFDLYDGATPISMTNTITAEMLLNGEGAPRNPVAALERLESVMRTEPTLKSTILYSDLLYQGDEGIPKDIWKARVHYRQAAWLGSIRAGRMAGILYYHTRIKDQREGIQWLIWAAERGDLIAQVELSSKIEEYAQRDPPIGYTQIIDDRKILPTAYAWMKTASRHPDAPKALTARVRHLKNSLVGPVDLAWAETEHLRQMNLIRHNAKNIDNGYWK